MKVNARIPLFIAAPGRLQPPPGRSRTCRGQLVEQRVDVLFGYLGKRRIERDSHVTLAVYLGVDYLENRVHLRGCALDSQPNKTKTRTLIENNNQYHPRRDYRNVKVVALTLVGENRKAALADQVSQSVSGGDVAGRQTRQAGRVQVEHFSVRGDLLAVLIDQKNKLGVRVGAQAGDYTLELLVLLFVQYNRSRHPFSSTGIRGTVPD